PTVSGRVLLTALLLVGASASAMGMATIPITTRGGGQWVNTVAAGIRTTGGEGGAGQPSPNWTEAWVTQRNHRQAAPRPIRIPAITVLRREAPITTLRLAEALSLAAVTTRISTQETLTDIVAAPLTTQTQVSSLAAEPVTLVTSTPVKARPAGADSLTTP